VKLRVIVAVVVATVATPVSTAFADSNLQPVAGGGWTPGAGIVVVIGDPGTQGNNGGVSSNSPATPSPYRYVWSLDIELANIGCPVPGDQRFTRATFDLAGNWVGGLSICLAPGAPKPASSPVPTIADIWKFALKDIARPALGVDPAIGLTGLDTYLWYVGPTTVSIGATIGEWTVIGTAHLESVTFDTGDGTKTVGAPFKTDVTYERKGDRTIVTTARWEADVVMTGPGVTALPTAIGAALLRSTQPYHVREIRSVLVP
jgi:hypothetical protein